MITYFYVKILSDNNTNCDLAPYWFYRITAHPKYKQLEIGWIREYTKKFEWTDISDKVSFSDTMSDKECLNTALEDDKLKFGRIYEHELKEISEEEFNLLRSLEEL